MKKTYFILVLVGIATTVVLSIAAFNSFQQLIKTIINGRDLRTQREELTTLLSDLKDAETGQRGYIITGHEDYLQPYYKALQTIDEHFRLLEKKLSVSLSQKLLMEELSQLIKLKLAELQDTIQTRRTQGFEAAQKGVENDEGKEYMDSIRDVMEQLFNNQNKAVEDNAQKVEVLMQKSFLLSLLGGIISSLLICFFSLMFYRDSIELTRVKKQFRQTNDLYKAILDSAKQMIITTDTTGMITSFNKGAEKILGYKSEAVINKMSILDLYDRKELRKKAEELTSKTKPVQYNDFDALVASSRYLIWIDSEWMMKKKNGNFFSSSQTITALRDESNIITGYLVIGSDVSDYKRWEQELQEAQQAIEIAQLSKNRFLASFNHEFRAPLNTIMKFSTILMKNVGGNLTDLEIAYATRMRDNCQSMLSLMNEIIDVSKNEEVLPSPTLKSINLDVILKKIINEMADSQNIQFMLEIPKDAKPLETEAENFNNLVKHFLRHAINHFQGQLIVRVKTDSKTYQPVEMEIVPSEVKSSGDIAIPMTSQQDSIDLAIAKSLAGRLGYQIKVTSRLGKGVIYSLILNQSQQTAEFFKTHLEHSPSIITTDPVATGKDVDLMVLVIDDDADFRSILTKYLQDFGCQVMTAATGAEVIQLANSHPIDLITMDMLMSPMNGYEVVQQLQSDPNLKNIPYAFISIIAKDIQNKIPGALAFINKPITRDDVVHLLQMCQAQRKAL